MRCSAMFQKGLPTRIAMVPVHLPLEQTGQPAVSVPIGFTGGGLPVGVQIIGGMRSEARLLRAAAVVERSRPLHLRRPPLPG